MDVANLVVSALVLLAAILVPLVIWRVSRPRAVIRFKWPIAAYTTQTDPASGVMTVRLEIRNRGSAAAVDLKAQTDHHVGDPNYPGGPESDHNLQAPLAEREYLESGPDPWVVNVPIIPWYWRQDNRGGRPLVQIPWTDVRTTSPDMTITVSWIEPQPNGKDKERTASSTAGHFNL